MSAKLFALLFLVACLAYSFEVKNPAPKLTLKTDGEDENLASSTAVVPALSSSVLKVGDGLKFSCQDCSRTCANGGFPKYCAAGYYCVCTYSDQCPNCVGN